MVICSSCSKEDVLSQQPKLHRIYAEGQLQSEYIYNQNGLLIKHLSYGFASKKTGEDSLIYDGSGKLLKKETSVDLSSSLSGSVWSYSYTEYSYDASGKTTEERTYLLTNNVYQLASKSRLAYDANGRITSDTIFLPDDTPSYLLSYQYSTKGNVILQELHRYNFPIWERHFTYSYDDYDDKINPYQNMGWGAPPFSINQNNILQTTITNYVITPGTPVITVNKTVYKSYNSKGLPVKVFENGTNFIYEYQ
jgi:hypothetical protein